MLYFAYCTLLDVDEMHKYCPSAQPIRIARLAGYRLTFATYGLDAARGGCNLEPAPGEELLGVLYELSPVEMQNLDAISGVDKGFYQQIEVTAIDNSGKATTAATYIIPQPGGQFEPSATYVRPILDGARAWSLPPAYISKLEQTITAARHESGS